jgi:hypothetical protein
MAAIATAMGSALAILAAQSGQALQYRATPAGAWTPFTGFLQPSRPVAIAFDEQRGAIMAPQTGELKVPLGGPVLLPGVGGAQVKDQDGTAWAVVGPQKAVGQSIYLLQRAPAESLGPARGTVP